MSTGPPAASSANPATCATPAPLERLSAELAEVLARLITADQIQPKEPAP
jgi:hypothetical protein